MKKLIIKFIEVSILTSSLILSSAVYAQSAAQTPLDVANQNLVNDQQSLATAQANGNTSQITQLQAQIVKDQQYIASLQKLASDQQALSAAQASLNASLVNQLQTQIATDQQNVMNSNPSASADMIAGQAQGQAAAAAAAGSVGSTAANSNAAATSGINGINSTAAAAAGATDAAAATAAASSQIDSAKAAVVQDQAALDAANAKLNADKALLADAQAGINRALVNQRQQELAAAQAQCPGYVPGNGRFSQAQGTCSSQAAIDAITTATNNLTLANTPQYDPQLIAQLQAQVNADQTAVIQAGYQLQYGQETVAGAQALKDSMAAIDSSLKGAETDIFSNPNGILKPVADAAANSKLTTVASDSSGDQDYKAQLQQDIIMVVIGQVTSRLNACDTLPKDLTLAIGAGQVFVTGEAAVYADTKYLQDDMKRVLSTTVKLDKQRAYLKKLLDEYNTIYNLAANKQHFRTTSATAFNTAAYWANNEEQEDQSWENACKTQNSIQVSQGGNQGTDWMMVLAGLAAAYFSYPYCAGCAAAIAVLVLKGIADQDRQHCSNGGAMTETLRVKRKTDCNQLGTTKPDPIDMLRTYDSPSATASKYIKDTCMQESRAVSVQAGSGCAGYSSNGAGPYSSCDKSGQYYEKNLVACPVSILQDAAGDTNTQAIVDTGIATGAVHDQAVAANGSKNATNSDVKLSGVDRTVIKNASLNISKNMDVRMASPLQRSILWTAFGRLAATAATYNNNEMQRIDAQRKKIQALLAELESEAAGVATDNVNAAPSTLPGGQFSIHGGVTKEYKLPSTTGCITGVSSTNCKSVSDSIQSSPGFLNAPPSIQDATKNVAKGLDAINNTNRISAAGLEALRNVSNSSGAIVAALAKSTSQLQDILKSTGSSVNLNDEANRAKNNAINGVASEMRKGGSDSALAAQFANMKVDGPATATPAKGQPKFGGVSLPNFNNLGAAGKNSTTGAQDPNAANTNSNANNAQSVTSAEDAAMLSRLIDARNNSSKSKYEATDEDSIFQKLTKAYIRNYDKVLTKRPTKLLSD